MEIGGKTIYKSKIKLQLGDVFIAMSDGTIFAGVGRELNFGWQRDNIIDFIEACYDDSYSAKIISTLILDECNRLYGYEPGDDTTVGAIKIRERRPVNLLFGPPSDPKDVGKMMSLFFAKEGKHIVSGGTTSTLAAGYLHTTVDPTIDYIDPEIPPIAKIRGVDLATEGVITMSRVLEYAKSYLKNNEFYSDWSTKRDGASLISRILFEEATDINFYVGRAINPAPPKSKSPYHLQYQNAADRRTRCLSQKNG